MLKWKLRHPLLPHEMKSLPLRQPLFQPHPNLKTNFFRLFSCNSVSSNATNLSTLLHGPIPRAHLLQIHARVYRIEAHQDDLIATRLIGQYSSDTALRVFNFLRKPNLFPSNAIIRVLAHEGRVCDTFVIFRLLKRRSLSPNDLTFSFVLKGCFCSRSAVHVEQIHTDILKLGFIGDPFVCNGLIGVYGKGLKNSVSARKLFDEMPDKDVICCWTTLISSLAQSGDFEEVLRMFNLIVEKNLMVEDDALVSVLSACSNLENEKFEKWVTILLELVQNVDSKTSGCDSVNNILVYLYGKWGKIEKSKERFDEISDDGKRKLVPWNSMINAYVQNGNPLEALRIFRLMIQNSNSRPNHVTMVSVLSACAQIGDLQLGTQVHEYMKSKRFKGVLQSNTFLATALIDMYSKCGRLDKAKEVFDQMFSKDVISFNAMIMGLAVNCQGQEALELFSQMLEIGIHPNAGTFLGLLWACSHSGLSDKGHQIFQEMSLRFCVRPTMEHYACYIDLLARVGRLDDAFRVATSMPFQPNNFVWGALLGGCLLHSRVDVARIVYKRLVEVDPDNSAGYIMLANALAAECRWDDVSVLRWIMRERKVKKQPGFSWISIGGIVHEFFVESPSHSEIESIHHTLHGLQREMNTLSA